MARLSVVERRVAVGTELRVAPPEGMGRFDMLGLHGGGGDNPSYVEALRQNEAQAPVATEPTPVEATKPAAEAAPARQANKPTQPSLIPEAAPVNPYLRTQPAQFDSPPNHPAPPVVQ